MLRLPTTIICTTNLQKARQHPKLELGASGIFLHKTPSHDVTECLKQGEPRPHRSADAITLPLQQGSGTRPRDDEKPPLKVDDDFEDRFAFTWLLAGSGNRGFHPNIKIFYSIVDSGASDHLID